MGRKSAAVLDVRSSDVTVVIGQRGVNNTFVIQGMYTQPYKRLCGCRILRYEGSAGSCICGIG